MDIENERSSFFKKMFSYFKFRFTSPSSPVPEGSTDRPLPGPPTTRLPQETTTESRFKWLSNFLKPNYERTPIEPFWREVNYGQHTIRPLYEESSHNKPTVPPKVERPFIIQSGSHFGLENCLWVALGGIGVMILMAIFMKLGKPIRRVRRQLSNNRPAPDVITVPLNPGDSNFDMGSVLRLGNTATSTDPRPFYDPPPPYMECVRSVSSINKYATEEPPPRYSATFEILKDAEPQVHIRRHTDDDVQNHSMEGVSVQLIAKKTNSNDSDGEASAKRTELMFNKGRIVERLSLDLHNCSTET